MTAARVGISDDGRHSELAPDRAAPGQLSASQRSLTEDHLPLARALARRFADRGEPLADLQQVAYLALAEAARRFDPDLGVAFSTYATVSVLGGLKRHFRDHGWSMRVPRRTQETYLALKKAHGELEQRLGRSATIPELSTYLGITDEQVIEAMEAGRDLRVGPLPGTDVDDDTVDYQLSSDELGFEQTLERETLRKVVETLDRRERKVLQRYFFDGVTQHRIGSEVGLSQMQVSRILNRAVGRLRMLTDS